MGSDDLSRGGWSGATPSQGEAQPAGGADVDVPEGSRYVVRRLLGAGGMGRVMAAEDLRLGREVALKEGNPAASAPQATLDAQLVREAWVMGQLEHVGVLPVYDAGTRADGRVFYTMPIVRGATLGEAIARAPDLDGRLRLLRHALEAAEAVAWAHRSGIVHRDLKPANIMLAEGGGTRVLDWALARLLAEPVGLGARAAGTPQYMCPEQARGGDCDERADVFSLGAVLFEVATGQPLRRSAPFEEALARAAAGDALPPRLDPAVPAELTAIIRRALAADPAGRYPNAGALAEELERYLSGGRVGAHDYSARELLGRFVKAWRIPLAVAGVALVAMAALTVVGLTRLAGEAGRARSAESAALSALDDAGREAARAHAAEERALSALAVADQNLAASLEARAISQLEHGARPEAEALAAAALGIRDSPTARGVMLYGSGATSPALEVLGTGPRCVEAAVDATGRALLCRTEAAVELWDLEPLALRWRRHVLAKAVGWASENAAIHTDRRLLQWVDATTGATVGQEVLNCSDQLSSAGDLLLAVGAGCIFAAWGPARNSEAIDVGRGERYHVSVAFGPDETWAILTSEGVLHRGQLGVRERRPEVATGLGRGEVGLALATTGRDTLLVGTSDGRLVTLDARSGHLGQPWQTGLAKVTALSTSASGAEVLAVGTSGAAVVVDVASERVVARLPAAERSFIGYRGDEILEVGREVRRWRPLRGPLASFGAGFGATSVAFSPDGAQLAVTHSDGFEVRRVADGAPLFRVVGFPQVPKQGAFAGDGGVFYVGAAGKGTPTTWETELWAAGPPHMAQIGVRRLAVLANGWLAALSYDGGVRVFPPGEAIAWPEVDAAGPRFIDLDVSPSRADAVVLDGVTGELSWLSLGQRSLFTVARDDGALCVAIGRDASLLASGSRHGVSLWDGERGALLKVLPTSGAELLDVAISPDEGLVAAGDFLGTVWLWGTDGTLLAQVPAHAERVSAVAFSPDGALLASAGWDAQVRLYRLAGARAAASAFAPLVRERWGLELGDLPARRAGTE